MVPGLAKQLAHPDIGPRAHCHAQAAPLTPLFVYLDISHKNTIPARRDSTILHFSL